MILVNATLPNLTPNRVRDIQKTRAGAWARSGWANAPSGGAPLKGVQLYGLPYNLPIVTGIGSVAVSVYAAPISGQFSASPPVSTTALGHGSSVTVAASAVARTVAVWGEILADGSNFSVQVLFDGSTTVANSVGAPTVDANGNSQQICIGSTTVPGDGNTHTFALAWTSVSNTNSRSVLAPTNLLVVG